MRSLGSKIVSLNLVVMTLIAGAIISVALVSIVNLNNGNQETLENLLLVDYDNHIKYQVENVVSLFQVVYDRSMASGLAEEDIKLLTADLGRVRTL